jgi:hypothetical protein
MDEQEFSANDFSYSERIKEIIPRIMGQYLYLKQISNNMDPLLKYAIVQTDREKKQTSFQFISTQFKKDGHVKGELDREKAFLALKKYQAMLHAKIKIRERDDLESSIQCDVEYLTYLSRYNKSPIPKILDFIDFTKSPARLDRRFREYMEIGGSELEKLCNEKHCSDENQVMLGVFYSQLGEQIEQQERKYFICESDSKEQ